MRHIKEIKSLARRIIIPIYGQLEGTLAVMLAPSTKVVPILVIAIALAFAGSASAAGDANQAKGIIAEHCADCHAVPGYGEGGGLALEAPPLEAFADDPTTYSEDRLRTSLRQPHWPMGQFRLSARDIDNILAFIVDLRHNTK